MPDPRVTLRKELAKLPDEQLLRRYSKNTGHLPAEDRARYKNGRLSRELMTDVIVMHETPRV